MRIKCPWCGPRPLNEFTYGGDASTKRPEEAVTPDSDADNLPAWMDHVYLRNNPAGPHQEYWHHVSGCRSWLLVTRDTTSHEIELVEFARKKSRGGVK